jgi:hypothetical protein
VVKMARLDKTIRARVLEQIPAKRCKATSKRSGKPCQRYALVGADVCPIHGGRAPQVRARAEERVTLADRLKTAPMRQTWEVLADTAHIADVLLQDARLSVEQGTFNPASLDALVSSLERAHRLSTSNHHAGLAERRQRFAEAQAQQMHQVFTRVLAGLGLSAEQKALVPGLLKREIEGVLLRREEIAA